MLILFIIVITFLLLLLDYNKRKYWSRRGIPQSSSLPFFGHFLPVAKLEKGPAEIYDEGYHYSGSDKPYLGLYEFWRPILLIKDPYLIEKIVVKDMSYFLDHPRWVFDDKTFVGDSIFNLKGNLWRAMRYQMTPSFTFKRMKTLFPNLKDSITLPSGQEFEAKTLFRTVSFDTILAFFGVKISNRGEFEKINRLLNDVSNFRFYELLIVQFFPTISELFGVRFIKNSTDNFVKDFQQTISSNIGLEFSKLLQKIKDMKVLKLRSKDLYIDKENDEIYKIDITDKLIDGQIGQFLLAGLDVNANSLMWLAYELAQYPDVQRKAREEIRQTMKKHGGEWSYLAVQDMKYIAQCSHESLRLHPPLPFLFRTCTTTYTVSDGLTINEGTKVVIPSLSIHMDPKYYPDPEIFRPERFDPDESFNKYTWLPFGEGPRKCLGMRLAQLLLKTTMSQILEKYEISLNEKTKFPVRDDIKSFLGAPLGKIYINLKPVSD
uniref:Putative cytochrome n=1 Tax=Triatoma dimidiata TaxID=72491 RepID=A0A0V0G7T6_TRIDM